MPTHRVLQINPHTGFYEVLSANVNSTPLSSHRLNIAPPPSSFTNPERVRRNQPRDIRDNSLSDGDLCSCTRSLTRRARGVEPPSYSSMERVLIRLGGNALISISTRAMHSESTPRVKCDISAQDAKIGSHVGGGSWGKLRNRNL